MQLQYIPRYSVAERQKWKDDWELIRGYPYAMSPSARGKHQRLVRDILIHLAGELKNCEKAEIYPELDWIISQETVVRPDLFVYCGEPIEDFLEDTPAMIIEILSPSTRLKDLNIKPDLYAQQGVRYYVMADSESDEITFLELIDGTYAQMSSRSFEVCKDCVIEW